MNRRLAYGIDARILSILCVWFFRKKFRFFKLRRKRLTDKRFRLDVNPRKKKPLIISGGGGGVYK